MSTQPEMEIAAGRSVDDVLAAFRNSVNRLGTMFSTERWLLPKLDQLRSLLSDPITEDEAQALLDVLHQRRFMKDLLGWLEAPGKMGGYLHRPEQSGAGRSAEARRRTRAQARRGIRPILQPQAGPGRFPS